MVGSIILSNPYLGAEWRNIVSDIIVHPKVKTACDNDTYTAEYTYDFAMMKIKAVSLPNLIPVVLNSDGTKPIINENLVAMGYGRISDAGDYAPSPGLRKATFRAVRNCGKLRDSYDPAISLCGQAPNKDPCLGDLALASTYWSHLSPASDFDLR